MQFLKAKIINQDYVEIQIGESEKEIWTIDTFHKWADGKEFTITDWGTIFDGSESQLTLKGPGKGCGTRHFEFNPDAIRRSNEKKENR